MAFGPIPEVTPAAAAALTSGGDTALHFHSADRARANHTGSQLASTISDFSAAADARIAASALTINNLFIVASQAAMLALSTARHGDVAKRTDISPFELFWLSTDTPGNLADWIVVSFAPVQSVNGQTGAVVLTATSLSGGAAAFDVLLRTTGDGYFLVVDAASVHATSGALVSNASAQFYLTKDTSWYTDALGRLVNSAGYYLVIASTVTNTGSGLAALAYDTGTPLFGNFTDIRTVFNDVDFALPSVTCQKAVPLSDFLNGTPQTDIGGANLPSLATVGSLMRVTAGTLTPLAGSISMFDFGFVVVADAIGGALNHTSSVHIAFSAPANNVLTHGLGFYLGKFTDNIGKLAAQFTNTIRKLYDTLGVGSVDADNRNLLDSAAALSLDWEGKVLSGLWSKVYDLKHSCTTLTGASNVFTLLPSSGKVQRIATTANSTLANMGAGLFDAQTIQVEWHCTGGAHTLTSAVGATGADANGFLYGSDFTALPTGTSGKTYLFALRWNLAALRWYVIPGVGGF